MSSWHEIAYSSGPQFTPSSTIQVQKKAVRRVDHTSIPEASPTVRVSAVREPTRANKTKSRR